MCVCFAVIDIQAFERLLGPCMEIMKRNIAHYEEQLVALFGSSMDLRDWQRLAVPYTPQIHTPHTCTHKHLSNLVHIVYLNTPQFVGIHSFLCSTPVLFSSCTLKSSLPIPTHSHKHTPAVSTLVSTSVLWCKMEALHVLELWPSTNFKQQGQPCGHQNTLHTWSCFNILAQHTQCNK